MWRPILNENKISSDKTSGIGTASWITPTPEHDLTVLILLGAHVIMKTDSESVQVANVERTEVQMELVIEKTIIDGEEDGPSGLGRSGGFASWKLGRGTSPNRAEFGVLAG